MRNNNLMIKTMVLFLFSTMTLFSQDLKCEDFKNGTFIVESLSPKGKLQIVRNNNLQTEKVIEYPKEYEGRISKDLIHAKLEWVDDCSYIMKYDESKATLEDSQKMINDNGGVFVKIDSIVGRCSYYKSTLTINGDTTTINGEICKE